MSRMDGHFQPKTDAYFNLANASYWPKASLHSQSGTPIDLFAVKRLNSRTGLIGSHLDKTKAFGATR